jgi:hypothetical protein
MEKGPASRRAFLVQVPGSTRRVAATVSAVVRYRGSRIARCRGRVLREFRVPFAQLTDSCPGPLSGLLQRIPPHLLPTFLSRYAW